MSDELLKNEGEGKDEEVEAHGHVRMGHTRMGADDTEGADDVEAHGHTRMANDDDDSDDVEAHRRRA